MDIGLFHSLWTVALMAIFVGIVRWAWSGKRKASFDRAARQPLDDDDFDKRESRAFRHD